MLSVLLLLTGLAAGAPPSAEHVDEIMEWRLKRLSSLTGPEGWLSLIGLHWLEPGSYSAGAGAENDIVFNAGPPKLGRVKVDEDGASFEAAPGVTVTHDGNPVDRIELVPDTEEGTTRLRIGSVVFYLVERSGQLGLRVKDASAPTRIGFKGLDYFPISSNWRLEARFEAHAEPRTIEIVNVQGQVAHEPNPGRIVFEVDGETYSLETVGEPDDDELFIIFADQTNGKSTYGAGRFVYIPWPKDGRTVVDFNRAYNPPCVFTEFSTCPLPPPENRLRLMVEAGEFDYRTDE